VKDGHQDAVTRTDHRMTKWPLDIPSTLHPVTISFVGRKSERTGLSSVYPVPVVTFLLEVFLCVVAAVD